MNKLNHVRITHDYCDRLSCEVCDLFLCAVCGGCEGSLLTYCPGYRLNEDTLEDIYRGNVYDLIEMRKIKANEKITPAEFYSLRSTVRRREQATRYLRQERAFWEKLLNG